MLIYSRNELRAVVTNATGYYAYVLFKPDMTPFYVGEGRGDRVKDHFGSGNNSNRHKYNIICKYKDAINIGICFCEDKADGKDLQDLLIDAIGVENLTNHLHPDDDLGGVDRHSQETKDKISEKAIIRFSDPEERLKVSLRQKERLKDKTNHPMYGIKRKAESNQKQSKAMTGKMIGEKHPNVKINEELAREIKYKTQILKQRICDVARELNLARDIVSKIKNNITWKHVTI